MSMKGLVLFGDRFEDTELIATVDVLIRHGEKITLASAMGRKEVHSKNGIAMQADVRIEEVDLDGFDFLFIPGGPGAFQILSELPVVSETISAFVNKNKTVASICAAPMLVGRLGYLKTIPCIRVLKTAFKEETISAIRASSKTERSSRRNRCTTPSISDCRSSSIFTEKMNEIGY